MENQTPTSIQLAEGFDPFGDDNAPQVQPAVEAAPIVNDPQVQADPQPTVQDPVQTPDPTPAPDPQPTFDPNKFIKERFGFESVEQAEQEFKKLKEKPEFDFENETSRNLFAAIKEGKSDEIFDILNQQKKLDRLTTANEVNADLAAEIIRTNIQNKYKDLTSDEVDLLFYQNFGVPLKPEQGYDETDEDYASKVKSWQNEVDYVEKRMIIEAKVLRPELAKLKSEIKLPDVYGFDEQKAQTQAEIESMQKARNIYEQTLNSEFNNFNGFNVSVKDEDVEIPIAFNVAEDERIRMKETLSDFDSESYFDNRWFNEDGKPKVQQVMSDIYVLENFNKILQKVANEAASQRMLAHIKKSGNITINNPSPQGSIKPDSASAFQALQEAVWS